MSKTFYREVEEGKKLNKTDFSVFVLSFDKNRFLLGFGFGSSRFWAKTPKKKDQREGL
jgi:hypothetical protein